MAALEMTSPDYFDSADLSTPLGAALAYAAKGIGVFPVWGVVDLSHLHVSSWCACEKGAKCERIAKHPMGSLVPKGVKNATVDARLIRAWWGKHPEAGVALAMGGGSRLVAVDVDGDQGRATLERCVQAHGCLPRTLTGKSGRVDGGNHYIFRVPERFDISAIGNSVSRFGRVTIGDESKTAIDVRGHNGYIIVAPTLHKSLNRVAWIDRSSPAELPEWVYREMAPPQAPRPALLPGDTSTRTDGETLDRALKYLRRVDPAISGQGGHTQTFLAAEHLVIGFCLSDRDAFEMLAAEYNPHCVPPWSERDLYRKVEQARTQSKLTPGYLLNAPRVATPALPLISAVRSPVNENASPPAQPATVPCLPEGALAAVDPAWEELARVVERRRALGASVGNEAAHLGFVKAALASIEARTAAPLGFVCHGVDDIFATLPPTRWLCEGLQWCPGRPSMLAGYGFSGKTMAAQSAALSLAAGRSIWGWFRPSRRDARVLHLDYEQGKHATHSRYQRLAIGLGIHKADLGDRLRTAIHPDISLTHPSAVDVLSRECEGTDLVIVDSLRGATPGIDENDSKIRLYLDALSRVSEKTGAMVLVIHHAGKPNDGHVDPRTVLRGSSAIFDACGSVFAVLAEKCEDGGNLPKRVVHVKGAAEAAGGGVESFYLSVEDVAVDSNPKAGVAVCYNTVEQIKPPGASGKGQGNAWHREAVLAYVGKENAHGRAVPGKTAVYAGVGGKKKPLLDLVDDLLEEGALVNRPEVVNGRPAPRLWLASTQDQGAQGQPTPRPRQPAAEAIEIPPTNGEAARELTV